MPPKRAEDAKNPDTAVTYATIFYSKNQERLGLT